MKLDITPLPQPLGAEIRGLDLGNIDDTVAAELQQALSRYLVLLFRNQNHGQFLPPPAHKVRSATSNARTWTLSLPRAGPHGGVTVRPSRCS